jgi:hypothetical protein
MGVSQYWVLGVTGSIAVIMWVILITLTLAR